MLLSNGQYPLKGASAQSRSICVKRHKETKARSSWCRSAVTRSIVVTEKSFSVATVYCDLVKRFINVPAVQWAKQPTEKQTSSRCGERNTNPLSTDLPVLTRKSNHGQHLLLAVSELLRHHGTEANAILFLSVATMQIERTLLSSKPRRCDGHGKTP